MGIDRHKQEHRNWRSNAASQARNREAEIVEQLDATADPDAVSFDDPKPPRRPRKPPAHA